MSNDLDDANDAAMDSFSTSDCESPQVQCPRRSSFLKRKLLGLKKSIRSLFSQETWDGLKIFKDNSGGVPIINMHGVTVDSIFYRYNKELEKDDFTNGTDGSGQ